MRGGKRLGLVADYEVEAVIDNGGRFGGLRNGPVPNHVYRWTEREVTKTVNSLLPAHDHEIQFFYGLRLPTERLGMRRDSARRTAAEVLGGVATAVNWVMPRQGNEFAFAVRKNVRLKPWLRMNGDGPELDEAYVAERFRPITPAGEPVEG